MSNFIEIAADCFDIQWFNANVEQRATMLYILNPINNVTSLQFEGRRKKINEKAVSVLVGLFWAKTIGLPCMLLVEKKSDAQVMSVNSIPTCMMDTASVKAINSFCHKTALGDLPVMYIVTKTALGGLLKNRLLQKDDTPLYATYGHMMSHITSVIRPIQNFPRTTFDNIKAFFTQPYSCIIASTLFSHPTGMVGTIKAVLSLSKHKHYYIYDTPTNLGDFVLEQNFVPFTFL